MPPKQEIAVKSPDVQKIKSHNEQWGEGRGKHRGRGWTAVQFDGVRTINRKSVCAEIQF